MLNFGQHRPRAPDEPLPDTSEQVYISSMALLKMLKHGRAGIPMEVMGLMLGEFIDDYTIKVVDVFSMPQSGNSVSVESVDEGFQAEMLELLSQTGRTEAVVGWYHSHPGFGCWFSGTDVNTQATFEQLHPRVVGVVVDPVQSVKGKVVIDCFRLIDQAAVQAGIEPRQSTSNIGHLTKPSLTALVHNLNRHYYSLPINYRKNNLEQKMLLNLHKKRWTSGLKMESFTDQKKSNEATIKELSNLAGLYNDLIKDEIKYSSPEDLIVKRVGKVNPRQHLESETEKLLHDNIIQGTGAMLDTLVF
eukprot:GDKJ01041409.1.p1 GENE.GDKJ01041409.1~~GDKJ01041409.1.p1  ORF type:complete len:303 (+),score=72.20 GDKJ01041409.1:35-943(+)